MNDDLGRRAGADARRAGSGFSPPDLDKTIRRRRRARVVGVVLSSAVGMAVLVGLVALLVRTEPEVAPADTTTTTTTPAVPESTSTAAVPETTTTTASVLPAEPGYGGVVNVGSATDLIYGFEDVDGTLVGPTINPLINPSNARDVARLVVPGAFRLDPDTGEATAWVVNPIPTVSNGGVVVDGETATVTYEIDPDAVWADGTPITFEDFAFTYELITSDDLPINSDLRELHSLIDGSTLAGEGRTVTFRLTQPDPRYERLFPWLIPAHAVAAETFADDWNERLWVSGGPFVFESYEATTSPETEPGVIHLTRNNNYWETDDGGNQLPYLDGIDVHVFSPAVSDGTTWFTTQSVDIALPGLIFPWSPRSLGDPDENGFILGRSWDSLYEVIGFEMRDARFEVNPDSLNTELLYRQAVLSAVDRNALAEETGYPVASSISGTASPGLDLDVWHQYDDPSRTADLLRELGDALGRDFAGQAPTASYVSSPGDATIIIGDAVTEQLAMAGWETNTEYTWDFFNINLREGLQDMFSVRLFAGDGLAGVANSLTAFDPTLPVDQIIFDWSAVGEPAQRYAAVVAEAQRTLDRDRLRELVAEAETILAENAVVYPLVRRQASLMPYWPARIQGVVPLQEWTTATAAWWWSPEQSTATSP